GDRAANDAVVIGGAGERGEVRHAVGREHGFLQRHRFCPLSRAIRPWNPPDSCIVREAARVPQACSNRVLVGPRLASPMASAKAAAKVSFSAGPRKVATASRLP